MHAQQNPKAAFNGSRLPRRQVHETLANYHDRKSSRSKKVREDLRFERTAQDFLDREAWFDGLRLEGRA